MVLPSFRAVSCRPCSHSYATKCRAALSYLVSGGNSPPPYVNPPPFVFPYVIVGYAATVNVTVGEREEKVVADISQFFDKSYEQQEFSQLADAPVDALEGLSEGDAKALKDAFGLDTVRELAENKFVRTALAVVALAR